MKNVWILAAAAFCFGANAGLARMVRDVKTQSSLVPPAYRVTADCLPNKDQCTHKVGRLWFSITNYGFFGNQVNPQGLRDCLTGGFSSSAEFPGGSQVEYLFQGALWVGAVVASDTLTSIGTDGWVFDSERGELHADCGQTGAIIRRSKNPASPYYDSLNAISDLDLIAVMYDTLTDPSLVENPDPQDGKPFKPMGLKIIQKSYSWSAGWGQDWVMLDYNIVNVGLKPLSKVFLGVFVDADVGHASTENYFLDDLSGFKVAVPNPEVPTCPDTINLVYVSDNDGDPSGAFRRTSPTAVTGIRVVRAPVPLNQVKTSFNWWTPNGNVALDWGPQKAPGRKNFSGGRGQPEGDAMKYFYISNGEIDYDEIWSAVNQNQTDYGFGTGWMPPLTEPGAAIDIAEGFDTRYVVGYGPFNLKPQIDDPADTLRITFGYIAGEGFHRDPSNFARTVGSTPDNFLNPVLIQRYQDGLNFEPVATNAQWVKRVFDNETNIDSVLCGDPPDTVERRTGDGIPDFKGPQPPPPPATQVVTTLGEILLRWFGKNTENTVDDFTGLKDFEGYRVQMSPNNRDYSIIGSFDIPDWKPYFFNQQRIETTNTFGTWQPTNSRPMTWEEIQRLYAVRWDTCQNKIDPLTGNLILGRPIDPDRFGAPLQVRLVNSWPQPDPTYCTPDTTDGSVPGLGRPLTAIRIRFCNSCGPNNFPVDTMFYFARQDYNLGLSQIKMYPTVTDPNNDSSYWYQYKISGLYPGQPVYVALTPFDFGLNTQFSRLDPLEVTPTSAAQLLYPLPNEGSRAANDSFKISVYPNPYRVDHDYSHYENPDQVANQNPDLHRMLNFVNLPAQCVIRIYTLDGDLVQEIRHDKDPAASDAGFETWDLLTRNAQMVSAGLYLYTVQSSLGIWTEDGLKNTYVGKIVIIK